jgi:hypothetical protein
VLLLSDVAQEPELAWRQRGNLRESRCDKELDVGIDGCGAGFYKEKNLWMQRRIF